MENSQYIFALILSGSLLFIVIVFAILSFLFIYRQKVIRHKMALKEAVLRSRVEVQEESLRQVSAELHDNVCQVLSMAKMLLTNALSLSPAKKDVEKFMRMGIDHVSRSLEDLRNLSHTLNSTIIEKHGFIPAINEELVYIRSVYQLKCHFSHCDERDLPDLSDTDKILLFRIVQESLQNIVRHAKATEVNISMGSHDGYFELTIKDNGIGMSSLEDIQSGLGFISMRERAQLMDAELSINSKPGMGSEISVIKMI